MFLANLIPVHQAIKTIENTLTQTEVEKIPLEEAYQRILARDIISLLDSPPFSRSAMDGYALKAQDTFNSSQKNPVQLTIIDRIGAGTSSSKIVEEGTAVKIATGAPIPQGADAVDHRR